MAPRNNKHPREEETFDQLSVLKRSVNSRQSSRQRSQSMTIQDDNVIKAILSHVTSLSLLVIELQKRLNANETLFYILHVYVIIRGL